MKKRNIILIGFMGTGKTTVARLLADRLQMEFIEMDSLIEEEEGLSIREIFERYGEDYFREKEAEVVRRVSEMEGVVVSTGGGVVLKRENMQRLRRKGVIVCLTASVEEILQRTGRSKTRPLLNVREPEKRIRQLLSEREPLYAQADLVVQTDHLSPEEVTDRIVSAVEGMILRTKKV